MNKKETKHFKLDASFDLEVLKKMDLVELNTLSNDIRNLIIKQCSIYGGHLSSNLGAVEIEVALYKYFNAPKDKILFDVGHQTYAQKILTGRPLTNLRQKDGCDGFQKRSESIYDCFEAGHSSTSLSTAMGMAIDRDLHHENYKIVVVIGDASFANGLSFEALNNLSNFNHQLIVILNDNDMSISKPVGALARYFQDLRASNKYQQDKRNYVRVMSKNAVSRSLLNLTRGIKNSFKRLVFSRVNDNFFNLLYYGPIDGNNIKELLKTFKKVSNVNKPVLIHAKTLKGKGYKFAEDDKLGMYHFALPFDIETGKFKEKMDSKKDFFSSIYSEYLGEEMKTNKDIVCISPATFYGSNLSKIFNEHKNRCFDVGISEEHAVLFANGMALDKKTHPYVFIYSSFLQRAYDEIHHDVCRMNSNVTFMIDRAGFVGANGTTHQGIYDNAFLMSIPNLTIAEAKDAIDAYNLLKFSLTYTKPLAIRYPNSLTNIVDYKNKKYHKEVKYLEWETLKTSSTKNLCLISYGPHISEINKTCKELNDLTIINAMFLYPINIQFLKTLLDYKTIIIYDPYGTENGFSYHLENALISLNYKGNIIKRTIPIKYVKKATILEQEIENNVDIESTTKFLEGLNNND